MGALFSRLRSTINRLLRLNLFLPLVAVGAVVVVILTPVLWSFYEASIYFGLRQDASPAAHVYEVNRKSEKYLEQAIALDNGVEGFASTNRDLMLQFTIDKVADLDLSRKTVFVSGGDAAGR